ncbi:DSD1 family PLP-dependent enzyme [Microvirga pudoricolor]|uniref:DSD1 family PLP-dependent enzyme n=1 Tax=Microvirga pudoricolor TaxID=2778729 RepID=UPI00195130EE|nr:DSD1 family PLP-dependent enzyme [Microvirga pudoricolor]MBM6595128.1 DSD1 family PLP-dependent enzyme [Microvirga pudoricolor]
MVIEAGLNEVGYDIPARLGDRLEDVQTPALIVDLDAFERNCERMRAYVQDMGVRLRAHAKTHKSADIARYQMAKGGACGICCQKVSEAEALARAGIRDILIANEVTDPAKIDRLARLGLKARIIVCVDDISVVSTLSDAAGRHGSTIEALVEIDCGARRCGVRDSEQAVTIAQAIESAAHLKFAGLQAYFGSAQHIVDPSERRTAIGTAIDLARETVVRLREVGLECSIVGGAGTGSYNIEGRSGIYNELQCGSYIFMDAHYGRVVDDDGSVVGRFENALFVLTSVMSHPSADRAVCDAGLKAHSIDSGLPVVFERPDLSFIGASDEHGVIRDPHGTLKLNERLKLVPGHCDPTCNLYDWYVGVRNGRVEALWPVTARGKLY